MTDKSCKTPRWRLLKAQLNNLLPADFIRQFQATEDGILIDVRTPEEFALGHIPKAINISYLADNFWDQMEQLSADKKIFVYCRTGRRSIRACTLMRNGGFDKELLFNLEGGYARWLEEIS